MLPESILMTHTHTELYLATRSLHAEPQAQHGAGPWTLKAVIARRRALFSAPIDFLTERR